MTEKPQVDFEEVVKDSGMPVTEAEVRERFNAIAADEGIITNTSRMSPFWRLITAIVTAPVMWLKDVLVLTVLANMFVATASGSMLRLLAWAVNVTAKPASAAQGVIPICFCAGLRGMWSDRSPLKTVFSAYSFVSW